MRGLKMRVGLGPPLGGDAPVRVRGSVADAGAFRGERLVPGGLQVREFPVPLRIGDGGRPLGSVRVEKFSCGRVGVVRGGGHGLIPFGRCDTYLTRALAERKEPQQIRAL